MKLSPSKARRIFFACTLFLCSAGGVIWIAVSNQSHNETTTRSVSAFEIDEPVRRAANFTNVENTDQEIVFQPETNQSRKYLEKNSLDPLPLRPTEYTKASEKMVENNSSEKGKSNGEDEYIFSTNESIETANEKAILEAATTQFLELSNTDYNSYSIQTLNDLSKAGDSRAKSFLAVELLSTNTGGDEEEHAQESFQMSLEAAIAGDAIGALLASQISVDNGQTLLGYVILDSFHARNTTNSELIERGKHQFKVMHGFSQDELDDAAERYSSWFAEEDAVERFRRSIFDS